MLAVDILTIFTYEFNNELKKNKGKDFNKLNLKKIWCLHGNLFMDMYRRIDCIFLYFMQNDFKITDC